MGAGGKTNSGNAQVLRSKLQSHRFMCQDKWSAADIPHPMHSLNSSCYDIFINMPNSYSPCNSKR